MEKERKIVGSPDGEDFFVRLDGDLKARGRVYFFFLALPFWRMRGRARLLTGATSVVSASWINHVTICTDDVAIYWDNEGLVSVSRRASYIAATRCMIAAVGSVDCDVLPSVTLVMCCNPRITIRSAVWQYMLSLIGAPSRSSNCVQAMRDAMEYCETQLPQSVATPEQAYQFLKSQGKVIYER